MTDFIPILETYVKHYKTDREAFIDKLGKLDVPKQVVSSLYELFLRRKEIEPIEGLTVEEKNRLWTMAKTFTEKKGDAVMISKSIYLLENIVQ